jgi:putative Mg2+ transporter-C (MgtC) family protein
MMLEDRSVLEVVLRLALAFVLALPIGWERERRSRSAGLRTYPLVAVGACAFLLLGQQLAPDPGNQSDVFYGLLTGVSFVGSGAMMKSKDGAQGMNTAVSLWVTAAMGVGVAYGSVVIPAALTLLTFAALRAPKSRARGKEA